MWHFNMFEGNKKYQYVALKWKKNSDVCVDTLLVKTNVCK